MKKNKPIILEAEIRSYHIKYKKNKKNPIQYLYDDTYLIK